MALNYARFYRCIAIPLYLCSFGTNAWISISSSRGRSSVTPYPPFQSSRLFDEQVTEMSTEDGNHFEDYSIDTLLSSVLNEAAVSELGGIMEASYGLGVWRQALTKGRLPTKTEFKEDEAGSRLWPKDPLFSSFNDAMVMMQLPRFSLRHPETISLILLSILRRTIEYSRRLRDLEIEREIDDSNGRLGTEEEDYDDLYYFLDEQTFENICQPESHSDPGQDESSLANEIGKKMFEEWTGVVRGMNTLDNLFGYSHDLLHTAEEGGDGEIGGGSTFGFGVQDGVWSHSGWQEVPKLQEQISNMPELNELILKLGRRPSAENSDRIHKFPPRKHDKDGGMGADFDPQRRDSVSGITLSGSFAEMLPSEAVLLCGTSPSLRRLFLAKKAESKLLSYQLSGWTDIPSKPLTRSIYLNRMPSAPGGPIIVCLDTSWSMSGVRESLSKAVVLSCVSAAHQQGRDCQVVAFSTERGIMEAGVISPTREGVQRLLEFLSHSFGGGTDVTGALKFALETLERDTMNAADILLVTDGEIPDPPVPEEVMNAITRIKLQQNVEFHGLLVDKKDSKPLSRICTETHNFLSRYDSIGSFGFGGMSGKQNVRVNSALYAKRSSYDEDEDRRRGKRLTGRNGKSYDQEEDHYNLDDGSSRFDQHSSVAYPENFDRALDAIKQAAADSVVYETWKSASFELERENVGICWELHEHLAMAIQQVEEGLVERSEDARLVVLAMIANEHILLLGKPGTGKSILGLRLARLCGGKFFQRLLTRFTTPEEIFGPLSLKSLENDEYRRVTTGFLPTAEVAFLDEIFKSNSAILNTLLTILNERKFDNAGGRESCPIRCVVGASNELPESDDLVALFDRFLIRKEVIPVSDDGMIDLLSMSSPGASACPDSDLSDSCDISLAENLNLLIESLSTAAHTVLLDKDACELIRDLRSHLRIKHDIEISDRRVVKAARLLKICAASDGRKSVDQIDFLLLQHCFWNEPEQRSLVRDWLWENLTPGDSSLKQIRFLLDGVRNEVLSCLRKTNGDIDGSAGATQEEIAILESLSQESNRIALILQDKLSRLSRHLELVRRSKESIWIDDDDAIAMQQLLLPRAGALKKEMKRAAEDARALCLALSPGDFALSPDLRTNIVQELWEDGYKPEVDFTEAELQLSMREAKAKYDLEDFRRWKRVKKKSEKLLN